MVIQEELFPSKTAEKTIVPPIKIQGIKTKLIPFIKTNIRYNKGIWYEPFMGSGVVGFNVMPEHAIFGDINPYIIDFYQKLQKEQITPLIVREFLQTEGEKLSQTPSDKHSYYYKVRDRFNKYHDPLDFLFLQRSNFNGMIRFSKNGYNVPFGRKPDRFRPALITKIVNQVDTVQKRIISHDWSFVCTDWKSLLKEATPKDYIYLDPPYIGRNTDYFTSWGEQEARELVDYFNYHKELHFALSMWYENKYRKNDHLRLWRGEMVTNKHFYFVGGHEKNRNAITEALILG
ncbi:DNA adenine methylase [Bartonella sp. CL63NXGY]|uniref:DNA adenine methylase n=1 Tax=Bartonella sp. CL63NXGY TaxID=3243538 RepID=UPI0035CFB7D3